MLYLLGPFAGICMHGRHQCANYSIMTNSFDSHRPKQMLQFVYTWYLQVVPSFSSALLNFVNCTSSIIFLLVLLYLNRVKFTS